MTKAWKECKIGEIVTLEQGLCINSKTKHLLCKDGLPLLRITDLINNTQKQFINRDEVQKKVISAFEDIIYTRTGQVGLVFKGKIGVVHNNCFKVNPNIKLLSREFLYWFLKQKKIVDYVNNVASGSAQPDLNHSAFKSIPIYYPISMIEQKKIATILSNYDNLIENNNRRIQILEQLASIIYDEWFVKFKFPGHKNFKMIDSEFGKIPEGWKIEKLSDCIELAYGKGLKKSDRISGRYPVYGSSGRVGTHSKFLIEGPGIIVGRKGNVGSVFWTFDNFYPIDTVFYVITNLSLYYVYFNLLNQNFLNNDAAVPGLSRNQAYLLPMLKPEERILELFEKNIKPIFEVIEQLNKININLLNTRGLLLPKLINGEIDVSDPDIKIPVEAT